MVQLPAFLAAVALGTMSAQPAATDAQQRPIHLATEDQGGTVELRVVGESSSPMSARYALEVTGGADGNHNRTVQRGTAKLTPGTTVVLMTLRLGADSGAHWTARLHVEPEGAAPYDIAATR